MDRRYGRDWLKCQKPVPRPSAPAPAPAPSTINYAPVFHSSGSAALFQSGGSAPVYNHLSVDKPITPADDGNIDSNSSLPPSDRLELGEEDTSGIGVGVGYEEEAAEDDRPDHDIANDNDGSEIRPPHIEEFNSAFLRTEGRRWCLSGGRDVETILHQGFYKVGHKGFYANLTRSFILDLGEEDLGEEDNDSNTRHVNVCKGWFSTEEWAEIMTTVPRLSQAVAIPLFKSLDRFDAAKTKAELRQRVCSTRFKPDDEPFVRDVHYDLWSADLAVQNVLGHWEDPNQPLCAPQLEDSLSSALWAPIIDHPLRGLRGVQMVHKESCCTSTASRRCRLRTETSERQASGPKIDGIIRSIEDDSLEFGSMEVSKSWGGVGGKSTKRLGDINKVIKSLRDMLFELHKRVGFNPAATKNIQVVGIICCGLKVQFFRMYGKGHIAILKREAIETVPIECSNFKDLKRLIVKFAMIKVLSAFLPLASFPSTIHYKNRPKKCKSTQNDIGTVCVGVTICSNLDGFR